MPIPPSPLLRLALLLSWLLFPLVAGAGATVPVTPQTAQRPVANRPVMVFRAPLAGYTPHERARAAQRRLDKALAKPGAQRAATRTIAEGTQVTGTVIGVGMFATRLAIVFGEEIALPDAFILANTVRNFSRARPGGGYMLAPERWHGTPGGAA